MKKPSVILTSQFTMPTAKSFTKYIKYMARKEALLETKELTAQEKNELSRIDNSILKFEMEKEKSYSSLKDDKKLSGEEKEIKDILKSKDFFKDTETDYGKYISYMGRQYALKKKDKLTEDEKKELIVVKKKIHEFTDCKSRINKENFVKQGVFSIDKEIMTNKDLADVNNIVKKSQKNGSIFYQDVISFDMEFLIKEKLYNPDTNELDEKRIQDASRKMMEKMFEDEKIESGYWFASIHRNTNYIHIHYGTVELENTRKIITVKEDGIEYLSPKGKRKQETIDNMKSTFANTLIDRTAQLSLISDLRNTLVNGIKAEKGYNKEEKKLLNEVYTVLPSNKKYWQYGNKHIPDETRKKIDKLTESLMSENPNYKEYIHKTEEESNYRKGLFGESTRTEKNYAENKRKDIQKRLGNSLLIEMKRNAYQIKNSRREYGKRERSIYPSSRSLVPKPIVSEKNINKIKQALNDDYGKYRAEKDYEQLQQRIAWEQQQNKI